MRYPDTYLMNHDIDWFCVVNGICIHVASAGGMIPNQVNDDETLRGIQHQVALLEDLYSDDEIVYNEGAIAGVLGESGAKARAQYVESFAAMARKGFASFDRTNIEYLNDNRYHLVCWPRGMGKKPQGLDLLSLNDCNMEVITEGGFIRLVDYIRNGIEKL